MAWLCALGRAVVTPTVASHVTCDLLVDLRAAARTARAAAWGYAQAPPQRLRRLTVLFVLGRLVCAARPAAVRFHFPHPASSFPVCLLGLGSVVPVHPAPTRDISFVLRCREKPNDFFCSPVKMRADLGPLRQSLDFDGTLTGPVKVRKHPGALVS